MVVYVYCMYMMVCVCVYNGVMSRYTHQVTIIVSV